MDSPDDDLDKVDGVRVAVSHPEEHVDALQLLTRAGGLLGFGNIVPFKNEERTGDDGSILEFGGRRTWTGGILWTWEKKCFRWKGSTERMSTAMDREESIATHAALSREWSCRSELRSCGVDGLTEVDEA